MADKLPSTLPDATTGTKYVHAVNVDDLTDGPSGTSQRVLTGTQILDSISLISTMVTQEPVGTDVVLAINFNPINVTSTNGFMSYDATSNKLTLDIGVYLIHLEVSYGRTGGMGESNLFFAARSGPLGFEVEAATSLFAKLDNDKIGIPANISSTVNVTVDGTQLDYIIWRDSGGDNSGGLFQTVPARAGAPTSPSASAFITKIG